MSSKPTIVLVPGAWHTASTWDKITSLLEAQSYKCSTVSLVSASSDPTATLEDDIDVVRTAITAETTQGRNVVVVVHSYGGIPGCSAIKRLTRPNDTPASSDQGYVMGMVFIASGFAVTGTSFLGAAGGTPPPSWKADTETGFATIVVDPRELFYHDLPEDEGNHWVSKLTKQSLKALAEGDEHAYSGWMDVPVWYVSTTADKAFPAEAQQFLVQYARGAGKEVTVREVESGHSPMLSRPKETAGFITEAAEAFAA